MTILKNRGIDMNRLILYFIAFLLAVGNCSSFKAPEQIPVGKWNYRLFVNGVKAGDAEINNSKKDNYYITSSEFTMEMGGVSTVSMESVTETLEFEPVGLKSYSKIVSGKDVHETDIKAVFKGHKVEITTNGKKVTHEIKEDFILDGNYTYSRLLRGGFKEGLTVSANVYHPSIELDTPIPLKTEVIGVEDVDINGSNERLIHIAQSIEKVKTIDQYIGSDGISKKIVIRMLNLKIELVRI